MENILEISDICKAYDGFTLDHVSFALPKGAIMGFIGENGAGKSTTIKAILGLVHIDSGSIQVFGKDMQMYEKENKEAIGVVLSESMFPDMMTLQSINKVLSNIYEQWDTSVFYEYMQRFQLPDKKPIKSFSKGMKMKLSIACALSHHPRLLLLDEATVGLDPVVREEILDVFMDFIQDEEHSILLSSHITSDIEKVADYVTFIHKGKILLSAAKDELLESYGILRCDEQLLQQLSPSDYTSYRKTSFSCDVLVKDKDAIHRRFPNAIIDGATLEDIMVFTVKGVQAK